MKHYRPTWVEIDLDAIGRNFKLVKEIVGGTVKVMAVVKANAYGHGIIEVSRVLEGLGVDYLGVATMDEAVHLRQEGIAVPILILGSIFKDEVEAGILNNITFSIYTKRHLELLDGASRRLGRISRFHLKVDTGMGRIGAWHEEALEFLGYSRKFKNIALEGIYTHFASADEDPSFTSRQMELFSKLLVETEREGFSPAFRHVANSMGVIGFKESHLNLVRPGLVIYGIYPRSDLIANLHLGPAFALKTRVVHIKETPPGRSISYGRTYITAKHTKIATLPIGYGDGYARAFSNKTQVLIRNKRANVVGRVTMDQIMVDVGHIDGVEIGDETVLIGTQGGERIGPEELAALIDTIPYEIVCMINNRVPRKYLFTQSCTDKIPAISDTVKKS